MATMLKNPTNEITATRFFGGNDRGQCLQLTARRRDAGGFDTFVMTRTEALQVAQSLLAFGLGNEEEAE